MPGRPKHTRGRANYLKKGDNNIECDRTGFKIKASEARKEWNGFIVRKESYERRQPQDLLKGFPDNQSVSVSRPGTGDEFLSVTDVNPNDL